MNHFLRVVSVLGAVFSLNAFAQDPLTGAWQYQETETLVPKELAAQRGSDVSDIPDGGFVINRNQASETRQRVYTFVEGYYHFFGIDSNAPRTLRRDVDEGAQGGRGVTNEQKLREYNPLDVEFGAWSRDGDLISMTPIMDHVPDNMLQDGAHDRQVRVEISGDQLKIVRTTAAEPGQGAFITDIYRRMN
jgi:hypothetical protein